MRHQQVLRGRRYVKLSRVVMVVGKILQHCTREGVAGKERERKRGDDDTVSFGTKGHVRITKI